MSTRNCKSEILKLERSHSVSGLLAFLALSFGLGASVEARPYNYPQLRYENGESQSMGGIALPLINETANSLFNNPAALAHNSKIRIEPINLGLEAGGGTFSGLGTNSLQMTSLKGMISSLNQNSGKVMSLGASNATAVSWGGLGIGMLFQERSKAVSSNNLIQYEGVSQFVPVVGYGVGLARGIVRLGYSLQYVNEAYGKGSFATNAVPTNPSFLSGAGEGHGFSHTASANFSFPFQYLPTFSVVARNIGGLHFSSGSMLAKAQNPSGTPADENMSVDTAFNVNVRVSGSFQTNFYFQYKDMTNSVSMPYLDHLSIGVDVEPSRAVAFRFGMSGVHPSAGIAYKGDSSEIGVAWYQEQNPFPNVDSLETRYTLQYKIYFQEKNTRNRENDKKGR